MKKAIITILGLLIVLIAVLCAVVAYQPEELAVTRSAVFSAPPERIFQQVDDFRKWDAWSPWAKIDPTMKATHSGASSGAGAVYTWAGTGEAGEGKMTITESRPSEYIAIDLEFIKPFPARNVTEFTFKPSADKTNVTWTMKGKKDFIMKAFCLVVDMDKMIGSDFEKGLEQLKPLVEEPPAI